MKKGLILMSIVLFTVFSVNSQVLLSKKGIPILPQQGDFAIGVSATPFLDFIGNVTKINSGTTFSSPAAWNWLTPNTIYGKYFLTDNMAIRGKIRIGKSSLTQTVSNVIKNNSPIVTDEFVEDKFTRSTTDIILSAGLEKRRGYGRLQGFYGVEAALSFMGGMKDTYEYGNAISVDFKTPARTDFGTNNPGGGGTWVTEASAKAIFGFGVSAFVGVEYFFAPKMSIGGEFGWGIGINQNPVVAGSTETITESWVPTSPTTGDVITVTTPGGKTSSFDIDTRQTGGNIFLLFHF